MMKTKSNSRIKFLLILLCTVCMVSSFSMFISLNHNTKTYASSEQTAQISGVQMRGAINGWYYYLVLKSDAYSGKTSTEGIAGATDKTTYSYDKIRLYKNGFEILNLKGSKNANQYVLLNFKKPSGNFSVYVNGTKINDYTEKDGIITVKVKFEAVKVTVG